MSKQESRRGNSALPTGQGRRGFPGGTGANPKDKSAFETIGAPSDGGVVSSPGGDAFDSITAGFPGAASKNQVKGGSYKPNDDQINRGYVPNTAAVPSTRNTTTPRLREGISPGSE